MFIKYSYDPSLGKCDSFIYGGCGGNRNRFSSLEKCNERCKPQSGDIDPKKLKKQLCHQPMKKGPCRKLFRRYGFDMDKKTCTSFIYGGCNANGNNFLTLSECEDTCILDSSDSSTLETVATNQPTPSSTTTSTRLETTATPLPFCLHPKPECETINNSDEFFWFFNSTSYQCEQKRGLCGTKALPEKNEFLNGEICKNVCSQELYKSIDILTTPPATTIPLTTTTLSNYDICQLEKDRGHARGFFKRFYYDAATNTCNSFVFGGEGGNQNNFMTRTQCETKCKLDITTNRPVTEAPSTTPAPLSKDWETRIHYDHPASTNKTICYLQSERGTCSKFAIRFYWSNSERRCKPFRFSGCGGNENNFISLEDCEHHCSTLANVEPQATRCLRHHEAGPCGGTIKRYRWSPETNECREYFWSGCMIDGLTFNGDKNNFISKESCECHCLNPESCVSKCNFHETYHFHYLGSDHVEGKAYSSIVCRNLQSTIGDFFDIAIEHKDVEMIDLRNNQLNNDDIHVLRMLLLQMPKLEVLLLGGNQLYNELDDHMFRTNGNLRYLDISSAGVHSFHKDTFDYLVNLRNLNMSHNHIEELDHEQFHLLIDLQQLDLSDNSIKVLQPRMFHSNRNLVGLDLSNNDFESFPKVLLKYQSELRTLDISGNHRLTSLNTGMLRECEKLEDFRCTGTALHSLPDKFFKQNSKLELVDLSANTKMITELSKRYTLDEGLFDLLKTLNGKGQNPWFSVVIMKKKKCTM